MVRQVERKSQIATGQTQTIAGSSINGSACTGHSLAYTRDRPSCALTDVVIKVEEVTSTRGIEEEVYSTVKLHCGVAIGCLFHYFEPVIIHFIHQDFTVRTTVLNY